MKEFIKTWWYNTGEEAFNMAVLVTVILTIFYYVTVLLFSAATWVISSLGLYWVLQAWIGISSGYLTYQIGMEYFAYKDNPENYSFWSGDEKEPTETGVE